MLTEMDGKSHSDDVSDGNGDLLLEKQRKGNCFYKVEKNLAESCSGSSVLWEAELVSHETGYSAEAISEQSTKTQLGSSDCS